MRFFCDGRGKWYLILLVLFNVLISFHSCLGSLNFMFRDISDSLISRGSSIITGSTCYERIVRSPCYFKALFACCVFLHVLHHFLSSFLLFFFLNHFGFKILL
jgi:protein-S-isoprenylcysteine O-methyltransferase Ste14